MMITISASERAALQSDLQGFCGADLSGVLVGAGSMILIFSNDSSVLIQSPFEVFDHDASAGGHGESPSTATVLFKLLNERITRATADGRGETTLHFGAGRRIRITADRSGFESYVLRTPNGILPVVGLERPVSAGARHNVRHENRRTSSKRIA